MNLIYDTKEKERVGEARDSFSGRLLTDTQFDESMAITAIIERKIKKSGAFKEKLGDYAFAIARTEKFEVGRAETILRDLFKARVGQSMNQMREELAEREEKLSPAQKRGAHDYAREVGEMIQTGDKISFYRAYAHFGQSLAQELGITDAGAKRLMKEEFQAAGQGDFYEWGKGLEEEFYRPQIEAEKQRRAEKTERESSRSRPTENGNGRFQRKESSESERAVRPPSRQRTLQRYVEPGVRA